MPKLVLFAVFGIFPVAWGGRPRSRSLQTMQLSWVQALQLQVEDLAARIWHSQEVVVSMFPALSSLLQLGEQPAGEPRHVKQKAAADISGTWEQRGGYSIKARQNGNKVLLESSAFPQGRASGVLRPLRPGSGRRHTVAWLELSSTNGFRLGHRARVLPKAIVFERDRKAFVRARHGHGTSPSSSLASFGTIQTATPEESCGEASQKFGEVEPGNDNKETELVVYHWKCIRKLLLDEAKKAENTSLIETLQRSRRHRAGGSAGGSRSVGDLSGLWSEGWVGHADGEHLVVHQQGEQVVLSGGGLPENHIVGKLGAASRTGHALLRLESPASDSGRRIRLSGKRMIFEDSGQVFTRAAGVTDSLLQDDLDPASSTTLDSVAEWDSKTEKHPSNDEGKDEGKCPATFPYATHGMQAFPKIRAAWLQKLKLKLSTSLEQDLLHLKLVGGHFHYMETTDSKFLVIGKKIGNDQAGADAVKELVDSDEHRKKLLDRLSSDTGSLLFPLFGTYTFILPDKTCAGSERFDVTVMGHPRFATGKSDEPTALDWMEEKPQPTEKTCQILKDDLAFLQTLLGNDKENYLLWEVANEAKDKCDAPDTFLGLGISMETWLLVGGGVLLVLGILSIICAAGSTENTLPAEKPPPGRFADASVPPVPGMQVHASPFGLPSGGKWMPPPVMPMSQGVAVPSFHPVQQHAQLQPSMMLMQPGMAMQGDGMAYAVATDPGFGMGAGTGMLVTGGAGGGMVMGTGMPMAGGAGGGMDMGTAMPYTDGVGLGMADGAGQDYSTDFAQPAAPAELDHLGVPPPGSI